MHDESGIDRGPSGGPAGDIDPALMLDLLPELVNRYRVSDHAVTYCNAAWAAHYNIAQAEAIGRCVDDFLSAHELEGLRHQLQLLGPDHPVLTDTIARAAKDGVWLEWADRYLTGPDGPEVLSVGRDVTARRQAELNVAESEILFRNLSENSADIIWSFRLEPEPHFVYMSRATSAIVGFPPEYFMADFNRFLDRLDEQGREAITRAVSGQQAFERVDLHIRRANGSSVILETHTSGTAVGLQGVSRDVTELRRLQEAVVQLAWRDPLTGLANRRLLDELLEADLARTERNGVPLAVAFIDLDDLKRVNDTHGHDAGDLVLLETALRLQATVRGADSVARIGGDEFVVVYEPNDPASNQLISRLQRRLSEPFQVSDTVSLTCAASIGVANTNSVGYDSVSLLASADAKMYEQKRARHAAVELAS